MDQAKRDPWFATTVPMAALESDQPAEPQAAPSRREPVLGDAAPAAVPSFARPLQPPWAPARDYGGPWGFFAQHWNGDYSLGRSYWLNTTLASLLTSALVAAVLPWVSREYTARIASISVLAVLALAGVLWIWSVKGTWASANRHVERGGSSFWAGAARVSLTLGIIRAGLVCVTMGPLVTEHLKVASGHQPGPEVTLKLLSDGRTLRYQGGINDGAAAQLERLLEAAPSVKTIALNSGGGWTREGERIAKVIADRHLNTYVESECSSACTLAFLAGRERAAAPEAKIGFHRFRQIGAPTAREVSDAMTRAAYLAAGLPDSFIQKVNATDPKNMWYPSGAELVFYRVVTRESRGGETASFAESVRTRDALVVELRKAPTLDAMAARYPERFQRLVGRAWAKVQDGRPDAEVTALVRATIGQLFNELITRASDELTADYVQLIVDEAESLRFANPEACAALMFPKETHGNAAPPLYPELSKRERALIAKVIAQSDPQATTPGVSAQSRQIWLHAARTLPPPQLKLISSATERSRASPTQICTASIAYLRTMLGVQGQDRAAVLRVAYLGA